MDGITRPLLREHSLILIASALPYDNNYFFDSDNNIVIASGWGWEELTNLPKTNGLVGFIISILSQQLTKPDPWRQLLWGITGTKPS